MGRRNFDALVCLAALIFYLVNRFFFSPALGGAVGWFMACYANDIFAGAAIVAWLDLLLGLGRLGRVTSWKQTAPFLLFCGLVWEVGAPLVKPDAVFDWWDFIAYQAGGFLWMGIGKCIVTDNMKVNH